MRIACLHTAASNISVFETAAKALGIGAGVLRHEVRADLLAAAENAGHLSADICASTASALLALAEQARRRGASPARPWARSLKVSPAVSRS